MLTVRFVFIAFTIGIASFLMPQIASAAAGDLDFTFGLQGRVITDFTNTNEEVASLAIQQDGKILAGGHVGWGGAQDFAIARYNPDGSLDVTFGEGGKVTTDFGNGLDHISALAIQSDGRIVAVGWVNGPDYDFGLARYNPDGSLDPTFDIDGRVVTDFGWDDSAHAVVIQADGKIVAAGRATVAEDRTMILARYNPDGTLDSSFGQEGLLILDFGASSAWANAVAIQVDGRILAAGAVAGAHDTDFLLTRLNSNGSTDTTFGSNGREATRIGNYAEATAVAVQTDGRIVVAGLTVYGGDTDFGLVRYASNGTLDTTFDGDGVVTTDFNSDYDSIRGMAIQGDGKIVVAGRIRGDQGSQDIGLARYNPDGSMDQSFDTDGKVSTEFGHNEAAQTLVIQPDGKIVVAGYSWDTTSDFLLARYFAAPSPFCPIDALFCDDFEDSVLDPDWTYQNQSWNEADGYLVGTPQKKTVKAFAPSSCNICTVEASMEADGGLFSKVFLYGWYQDKQNHVRLLMDEERDRFVLKQISGGRVVAKISHAWPIAPGKIYQVQIGFDGVDLTLNVDNLNLCTLRAVVPPNGTTGVGVKNTVARFNHILQAE